MNWIDKRNQINECAMVENCKINRLLFADDLNLHSSTESSLQRALNDFAAACDNAGMKLSTIKTEVLIFREPDQSSLQMSGASLKQLEKFKYLWVVFMSDGRQDVELDTRMSKANSAVMRTLQYSVVMKRELTKKRSSRF